MNERIKQLIKESGFSDDFIDDYELGYAQQKFAELIIKECIEVINDNVEVALSATGNVVYEDELLKKHFGVK
jgi:hypothetical protein